VDDTKIRSRSSLIGLVVAVGEQNPTADGVGSDDDGRLRGRFGVTEPFEHDQGEQSQL
jgi:hypothetical protein